MIDSPTDLLVSSLLLSPVSVCQQVPLTFVITQTLLTGLRSGLLNPV